MAITREEILEWTKPGRSELRKVEFKLEPPPDDEGLKHVVRTVAGIANLGGGCIIFGVGDVKDEAGRREQKSVTLAVEETVKWFERVSGKVRTAIQPFTNTSYYDVSVSGGWTVVVLEVPPPRDPHLRLYEGRPITRTGKPETVKMEPEQVWLFHKERFESEAMKRILGLLQQAVQPCLAEMAFRMYQDQTAVISEDEARLIAQKHADRNHSMVWDMIITHDALHHNQQRRELSFICRPMRNVYAALYLNKLTDEELLDYVSDELWDDVITTLGSLLGAHRLKDLVDALLRSDRPLLAIHCVLGRTQSEIDWEIRNKMLNFIRSSLGQTQSDIMLAGLTLHTVRKAILKDPDQYLRLQLLNSLEEVNLPLSFLASLLSLLNPDNEPDNALRSAVARAFAQVQVSSSDREAVK